MTKNSHDLQVNLFENLKLKKIADATKIIAKDTNKPTEISDLMVEDILPDNKRNFYIYEGSLTTPDCNEAVTFIVFEKTLHIGWNQVTNIYNNCQSNEDN